jgi:AmiR/NasT family two-component response regulator
VIEQAKGFLAQVYGVTVDEAFDRLRRQAREHGTSLSDLARQIVDDPPAGPR